MPSVSRLLVDLARYAQKPAEPRAAAAHRRFLKCVAGKSRQETPYRDRAFEPRQRHPGALVRAGAKREVPVWGAADIECFRIGKLLGIAVGRADAKSDQGSGSQRHATEFDLRGGDAVAVLVRAFKSQDFLDRGLDQVRMFDQALLLGVVRRQRDQSVANQIRGGLVSGVEQKDA